MPQMRDLLKSPHSMLPKCKNASTRSTRPRTKVVTLRQAQSVSPVEGQHGRRSAQTGFRQDIEGLRAVAVVAVVLFHADVPGVGGGYVGVDVFFVISGFLITGLLWREVSTAGTIRLRRFYGARARRLLPASATVGVVTAIASAALLAPLQAQSVFKDGIACALYVGNYWFLLQGVDYLSPDMAPSPFQHYWSLGVEEQFYLVWPPLIIGTAWLIRRVRRRTRAQATSSKTPYLVVLALVAAVSFALSLVLTYVVASVAFFSLPTRAWQLAAGGLVALTAGQWRRLPATMAALAGWAGLALILLACTLLSTTTPYPGTAALVPVLGTALVIGAGCAAPSQGCGRLLALPPMRAVGRVSYSWYLWHWPVLLLAPPLLGHPLGLAGRLAAVLVSAGLAVLTLHLLENPLRFAAPVRRSPLASLALGGVATAVAVVCGRGAAGIGAYPGRPRRPGYAADHHCRASPHGPQHCRLRHRRAVRGRAGAGRGRGIRRPESRTLEPGPARSPARQTNSRACCSTAACAIFSKVDSLSVRRAIPPPRRRWPWSATRMRRCGVGRSSRSPRSGAGGWKR